MSVKPALSKNIDSLEDDLVELAGALVASQSVTGNERPAQEVVIDRLKLLDIKPDVWEPDADVLRGHKGFFETSSFVEYGYEGRPNVAAHIEGGNGRTLTVGGHIDVVDVTPAEWERDPWKLTKEGDTVYGRGVADMKGGIAAVLIALEAIQEVGVDLGGDLIFQSTIEEEDGGVGGTLSTLERGYVPDAAIIAEPFAVPNVCVASAGVMYFKIHVPGKSVHAAWGHEGVNAIGKAAKIYQSLEKLDNDRKSSIDYPPAYRQNPELEGNVTNLNIGTIESGDWPSTVPSEAVLEGRIGWPPGETRDEVRSQIECAVESVANDDEWLTEHPPTVEWFGWQASPHETPSDAEIVKVATEAGEAVTGKTASLVGGNAGLDERFFQRYYDVPAISVGPKGYNLHGADEHTTVTSLLETSETIAHSIIDYLGTE